MLYSPNKVHFLLLLHLSFLTAAVVVTLIPAALGAAKPFSYQLGQVFGVLALSSLPIQLLLASRVKILESGVGLDRIMRWHSWNARLLTLFVLLHPALIFLPSVLRGASLVDVIRLFNLYHWLGVLAVVFIFFTIGITVFSEKIKLNYEYWKVIHRVGYLIVILGFTHSYFVGSDILTRRPLFYWWLGLAALSLVAVAYRYIYRPWKFRNCWYEVVKIVPETHNVRSIYLESLDQPALNHAPGQFAFVTFESKNLPREEHHFTISSPPSHNPIRFTIKESGDFTSQLGKLQVGDRAKIEGPYGTLSNVGMKGPFVFIAGGIGITPIMSMLRTMQGQGRVDSTLLIYVAKTRQDLVFRKELEELDHGSSWFRLKYVFGHITADVLQHEVQDFLGAKFFVVGPPTMIEAVRKNLIELGVPKAQIFTERFALR